MAAERILEHDGPWVRDPCFWDLRIAFWQEGNELVEGRDRCRQKKTQMGQTDKYKYCQIGKRTGGQSDRQMWGKMKKTDNVCIT